MTGLEDKNDLPAFDRKQLMMACDGERELLRDFVAIFCEEYPGWMLDLREAVDSSDANRLARAAHCIKGALKNFHAHPSAEVATRLEICGNTRNLSCVRDDFLRLEGEIARLKSELIQFVNSGDVA